jgi:hypothetical protein
LASKSSAIGVRAVEIIVELVEFSIELRASGTTKLGPK